MRTPFEVTPDQAAYVLKHLLEQRRIGPTDVTRVLAKMPDEIRELEARLSSLRGVAASVRKQRPQRGRSGRGTRSQSPSQRASFKKQGEYLNLLRHLTPKERERYKKIAHEKGRSAAVAQLRADKTRSR